MAAQAFGLLLSATEAEARYDCGRTEDDPERGVVVVRLHEPDRWHMEGRDDRPAFARNIAARALRLRSTTGTWPSNASYQS